MDLDRFINKYSTSVLPSTDFVREVKTGKTSWGQVAYELFQNSGEFVNLDRFQGIADILTAEPWNELPNLDNSLDLLVEVIPEIDIYRSALQNGIDIYEDLRNGIENRDVSQVLQTVTDTVVNWSDPFRNKPSNEI